MIKNGNANSAKAAEKRNHRSLTARMWLMIAVMLLLFGIAYIISTMVITNRSERDYEIRESETVINNIVGSINADIENYKDISRLIMLDSGVNKYLRAEKNSLKLVNDAKDGVMSVLSVCRNIDSVYIFRNDGEYMSTGRGEYLVDVDLMNSPQWRNPIWSKRGSAIVAMNGNSAIFKNNGMPIITIARAIYDFNSQKQTGILLMNISENMLSRKVQAENSSSLCVLSREGELLAGSAEVKEYFSNDFLSDSIVYREIKNDSGRYMISGCAIDDTPFVIMYSTKANTDVVPKEITYVLLLLLASFVIAIVLSSIFIMRNITRPIKNLSSAMEKTKESGWLEKLNVEMPKNEIGMLADSYNSMIEHLNELFRRLIENEKTLQRAEMRVLHEQIKPHFLYNSLETISFMAMREGAEDVQSALETLGGFYRNFLSKGDREIPLQREVCIIQDYLSLQKLRYGDVLNDEYDIADDTKLCMIPKLILQPLVENSIYHGIRFKGEAGTIRISSRLINDMVHIYVYDTGIGISQSNIEALLSNEKPKSDEGDLSGFGLRGTIERIRCYCDSDDVVRIRSVQGEFTEIEITIPRMMKEKG